MSDVSLIKNESGFFPYPIMEKHGKLSYELGVNRKDTLAQIAGDIHKAALVMGISVDGEKSVITASEAMKKIVEVYPTAWVKDVSKAIEMASFGQIKLPDQLTTLSAANIFQWYRELRFNHPEKIGDPMEKTYTDPPPISPEEKFKVMLDAFLAFIKDPKKNEMAVSVYYERFKKMGLLDIEPEVKTQNTIFQLRKLVEKYPLEILNDRIQRKQANEFRQYFNELPEPKVIQWGLWAENPLVRHAIEKVKAQLLLDAIEFYEHDEIISNYKTQISDELKIAL